MTYRYYVSARDAGKTIPILGPFTNEELCKKYAYGENRSEVTDACYKIDPKSHFYEYGMFRVPCAGIRLPQIRGILNRIDPEKWDKVLA